MRGEAFTNVSDLRRGILCAKLPCLFSETLNLVYDKINVHTNLLYPIERTGIFVFKTIVIVGCDYFKSFLKTFPDFPC